MKLISISLEGFRRFAAPQRMHLDCRVVALLGPNEAGKSSLLEALSSLNDDSPYQTSGPSQQTSRNSAPFSDRPIVEGKFLLESSDLNALADIHGAAHAKWLIVKKFANGARIYSVLPAIVRDLTPRKELYRELDDFNLLGGELEDLNGKIVTRDLEKVVSETQTAIDTEMDTLPNYAFERLQTCHRTLVNAKGMAALATQLAELLEQEQRVAPAKAAEQRLISRIPQFIWFDDEDRELQPNYDLRQYFAVQPSKSIPRALANMAGA